MSIISTSSLHAFPLIVSRTIWLLRCASFSGTTMSVALLERNVICAGAKPPVLLLFWSRAISFAPLLALLSPVQDLEKTFAILVLFQKVRWGSHFFSSIPNTEPVTLCP